MLSVRNAEFVLALLLLFLFLCTEKYLELKISNLCLLCFVCLFMKNCRDFGQRTLAPIPWGLFMFIARYCLTPRVLLLFLFRPREEWEKLIWNPLRPAALYSSTGYESVAWTLAKHKCLFMSGFLGRREFTEFPQHFQGDCVPWQRTGLCSHNQQLLWVPEILYSRGAGVQYIWEVTREIHVKGGLATSTLTRSLARPSKCKTRS